MVGSLHPAVASHDRPGRSYAESALAGLLRCYRDSVSAGTEASTQPAESKSVARTRRVTAMRPPEIFLHP